MTDDILAREVQTFSQWYTEVIEIRGCMISLLRLRSVYRELDKINQAEGDRIIGQLRKPPDMLEDDFNRIIRNDRVNAFKITITIVGSEGGSISGDTESIFDSVNIPSNIKLIHITNEAAYRSAASGNHPPNKFHILIDFDKPPLLDSGGIISDPTRNRSNANINAQDIGYFRAIQSIVRDKLMKERLWYSFLHMKFSYDIGLWFFAWPYALYIVSTNFVRFGFDKYDSLYKFSLFIYSLVLILLFYRSFAGYIKWALPVNILADNKDRSLAHRTILGAIVVSLFASLVESAIRFPL